MPNTTSLATNFPEDLRLKALQDLKLLDTPDELEFDQLVHLASQVCGTPISLVSLVDQDRQWFKAALGLADRETPRSVSFCAHAIQQPDLFVVEDATVDERFINNSLVTDGIKIRFYAGMPIHAPNGAPVGTLCVIDTEPRTLTEDQRTALTILSLQVQARMELRAKKNVLEIALEENRRLNQTLQTTNAMFQTFMDNGPFMSFIKDPNGKFLFYNGGLADHFQITDQQWIGKSVHDLFPKELADEYRQHDLEVMYSGVTKEFAEDTVAPNGDKIHWKSYKFPLRSANGEVMLAGISVDVTQDLAHQHALARANAELARLATTDALTGLTNRRAFQPRIENEFEAARNSRKPLTLVIMDVDNFKRRNDELGHAAGDEALAFIGAVLRDNIRASDIAVRLGGEEFALVLPGLDSYLALKIAQRIQNTLRNHPKAPANLTMSIGIATVTDQVQAWDQLFAEADEAMYKAKTTGKNRIISAMPGIHLEARVASLPTLSNVSYA